MAKLEFSAYELIELIFANDLMPKQIASVEVQGNTINIRVLTGIPFPKTIELSLSFVRYNHGVLFFHIHTSWLIDKVLRFVPLKVQQFINLNFPNLEIYLQKIISQKLNKLEIESIQFQNGHLTIRTQNR